MLTGLVVRKHYISLSHVFEAVVKICNNTFTCHETSDTVVVDCGPTRQLDATNIVAFVASHCCSAAAAAASTTTTTTTTTVPLLIMMIV